MTNVPLVSDIPQFLAHGVWNGGPGTLLVLPSIDMADTINEKGLPGGLQAARAAIKWAQLHVDKD